jgi:hypothetical protein
MSNRRQVVRQDQTWIADQLRKNRAALNALQAYVQESSGNPFALPPYRLTTGAALLEIGETLEARFSARSDAPPAGIAWVQADYLGAKPGDRRPLQLDWKKGVDGWMACARLRVERPGNGRIVWEVDGVRLSRVFGVLGERRLVVTLWVGSNNPPIDREIHQYDLPGDTWQCDLGGFKTPAEIVEAWRHPIQGCWRCGDRLAPLVNVDSVLPGYWNRNLFKLDDDTEREVWRQVQELYRLLGIPLDVVASYTPGHRTVRLLKELGIPALNSLCPWQNVLDGASEEEGGWIINHVGAPNAPYYPSTDDFRRVAPQRQPLVFFSMGTTTNVRMYNWFFYDGCATNTMHSHRYGNPRAIEENARRFHAVADGWIHDTANNPQPLFVTVALENFTGSPHWQKANADAADYLVRRAGENRIVFASAADVAAYYQRHYARQPEHVFFQPDTYAGERTEYKPHMLPDRIEWEGPLGMSLHRDGEALPQFLWDYTAPWNNPEWADQAELRTPTRHVAVEQIEAAVGADRSVPRQVDLRGVTTAVTWQPETNGASVEVMISSPHPLNLLPVALWHVPVQGADAWTWTTDQDGRLPRIVPVRDGFTGNRHALALFQGLPSGITRVRGMLKGMPQTPVSFAGRTPDGTVFRTFRTAEETHTYLWRDERPLPPLLLPIRVPPGSGARVRYNDGTESVPDGNGLILARLEAPWQYECVCLCGEAPLDCGGRAELRPVCPWPVTPFVRMWRISPLLPGCGRLEGVGCPPAPELESYALREFDDDFASLHAELEATGGDRLVFLASSFRCDESMALRVCLGYDGPVKLWLDGRELLYDPHGTNPAVKDRARPAFDATPGVHEIIVALGSNDGKAWGVYLRLERVDLTSEQLTDHQRRDRMPVLLSRGRAIGGERKGGK